MKFPTVFSAAILGALAAPDSAAGQSGVEDGIDELAKQIVARSGSEEPTTIAISAFPHVDDTCSELSNFLVDELVLSLFDVPDANLQIIERSQLGRIFAELELSMSGAVDANTTQELGRIHGVDTLLVGSLTTLGDDLRVNARMLNTETGQVFSAAAVNIAKTSTVEDLMSEASSSGCTLTRQGTSGGDARVTQSGGPDRAATISLPAFEGDLKIEELAGKWSGHQKCGVEIVPRALYLHSPSPIGLQYNFYHNAKTTGGSYEGSFNYDLTQAENGGRFMMSSDTRGIPFKLVAENTLYGEFQNEEGQKCSLSYGKYDD